MKRLNNGVRGAKYCLMVERETGERYVRLTGGRLVWEKDEPVEYARLRKLALANAKRRVRDDVMRDHGLVKVRGANGGAYWE
jgi:hypothetical protein